MRFLVQWQHVSGATQHRGVDGLARVIGQLQGYETAVGAWEREVLARRVRDYQPAWLDQLCHQGEVTWLRLRPPAQDDPDRRVAGATRTTPVSLVLRADLPWLLAVHRGDTACPCPRSGRWPRWSRCYRSGRLLRRRAGDRHRPGPGRHRGRPVGRHGPRPAGLGRVRAGPGRRLRSPAGPRRPRPGGPASARAAPCGPRRQPGAGPSCPAAATDIDRDDLAEALADQLLERWGVVFYDLVAAEHPALRWRDLQWALRRMEDRGLVNGGRFVRGFSGEQFALPQAAEALQAIRKAEPSGRTVRLPGTDPLNLTGVVLPGDRVPARSTEWFDLPV